MVFGLITPYIKTFGRSTGNSDLIQHRLILLTVLNLRLTTIKWSSYFLRTWRSHTSATRLIITPKTSSVSHMPLWQNVFMPLTSPRSAIGEQKLHLAPRSAPAGSDSAPVSVMIWLVFLLLVLFQAGVTVGVGYSNHPAAAAEADDAGAASVQHCDL